MQAKRAADPWRKLKARWIGLLDQNAPEAHAWLKEAEQLVFDTVSAQSQVPFTTRRQALQFAARRFGEQTAAQVSELFATFERTRYSPNPPPPPQKVRFDVPAATLAHKPVRPSTTSLTYPAISIRCGTLRNGR